MLIIMKCNQDHASIEEGFGVWSALLVTIKRRGRLQVGEDRNIYAWVRQTIRLDTHPYFLL